jgi:1-pyrroline-5-carboxylate dehydrogenase
VPGPSSEIAPPLWKHKDLAGVHFTGSTEVFQDIWKQIGNNISSYRAYPRLVGETGGKDFIFIHHSADPIAAATALTRGSFEYQGQKCSAASRAYIAKSIWPKVKEVLSAQVNDIKMGDPTDFSNFMGAVIDERSFDKLKGAIDRAQNAPDAKVILGGKCSKERGYFIQPTVIETTNPKYETMVKELFGPVLTVYIYDDKDFAATLELCDQSTPYALTGAFFSQDRQVIAHASEALRFAAGNFYINDKPTGAVVGQQPFGGARASGTNDKAGSMWNLIRWCSPRTIKETLSPPSDYRYPYMS